MDPAKDFVDFYEVLGVPANATEATIEKAINELQRKWRSRQNSPDPKRRVEAEEMMRTVEAAEVTLKDRNRRQAFDRTRSARYAPPAATAARPSGGQPNAGRRRTGGGSSQAQPPPRPRPQPTAQPGPKRPTNSNNPWVRQANELLNRGANEAARIAAKRAVDATPSDPDSWTALGHALVALGRVQEAQLPFREAVAIAPTSANRVNLAKCRMMLGYYGLAFESLSAAYSRDPGNLSVREALVLCYVDAGNPELALPLAEAMASQHPHHQPYQRQLAWVLYKTTVSELTETTPGLYLITSKEQARIVKQRLGRAWNLQFTDDQLKAEIKKWYHVGEASLQRNFNSPDAAVWFAWIVAFLAGVLFSFALLPLGLIYLAIFSLVFNIVQWRPQWQLNRRAAQASGVTKWGL
ncbi:MAG: DnaJ domain-containing protein [Actinomycetes bacterium]